jgi:hypothetical protein
VAAGNFGDRPPYKRLTMVCVSVDNAQKAIARMWQSRQLAVVARVMGWGEKSAARKYEFRQRHNADCLRAVGAPLPSRGNKPAYVAVALQRWADMTGQTPELVEEKAPTIAGAGK